MHWITNVFQFTASAFLLKSDVSSHPAEPCILCSQYYWQ